MLLFLYLGFILSIIFIILLSNLEEKKIYEKNIKEEYIFTYFAKKMPGKIIICLFIMIFNSVVLPYTIWFFGAKETSSCEKVIKSSNIYNDLDKDYHIKVEKYDDKTQYVFNTIGNDKMQKIDSKYVEIVNIGPNENPRIDEIDCYKSTRLKNKNFITKSVNNMFCFISGWDEKLVGKKSKIYIQSEAIKK